MEYINKVFLINFKTKLIIAEIHPNSNYGLPALGDNVEIKSNPDKMYIVKFRVFNYSNWQISLFVEEVPKL
jgi:hypothetical protein